MDQKIKLLKVEIRALLLTAINLFRKASQFCVVERQNRIKNGQVMPIQSWGKSGVLAYFVPKISHFGQLF